MGLFDKLSRDSKEEERASFSAPTPAAPAPPAYSGGESGHGYPADSKTPIPTPAQSYSSAPQAGFSGSSSQAPGSTYAALLLSRSDRIRIINFPGSIVQPLDAAIKRVWAPGVQQQGAYDQASWEWKLSGRPWYGQGSEAVPSRRLIAHVLHALLENGWHLAVSTDLSKKGYDKDTLIFKSGPSLQRFIFPVSFNQSDKIRLIDPPHEGIKAAFDAAIRAAWTPGIQEAKDKEPGAYQMKLRGNPWWTSSGDQTNHSRMLACTLLSAMDSQGFDLLGSVDMSMGGGENQSELDSWFFVSRQ